MRHRRNTKNLTLFDQVLRFKLEAFYSVKQLELTLTVITCNDDNNNNNNNNNNNI